MSSRKSALIASLQSKLEAGIKAGSPGLSACISSSTGPIWASTAGLSNLTSCAPLSPTHLVGIGSITKVFITVIILQLIETSHISLDSTVGSILDEEVLKDIENASTATIASLLSHTSGIESWEDDPTWIHEGRGKDLDPSKVWDKKEPLRYIRRPNPNGPKPGVFSYSNTNFTLAGLIVDKITGKSAEHELRTRVLEELSMKDTLMEGFEERGEREVTGRYHWATEEFKSTAGICPSFSLPPGRDDIFDASTSNLSVEWAAGGLLSTPSDLCTFALGLPKLLSASSLAIMQDWGLARPGMEIGHGLFRYDGMDNGDGVWLCHFGGVLGYSALLMWKEDGSCAVSVLGNVGTMHCGKVPTAAIEGILGTGFLGEAVELAGLS